MYALEVNNLEFGYKDDLVIKDISFSIEAGSFVSIIGPNGSGKSTLLKTLNQIFKFSYMIRIYCLIEKEKLQRILL